MGLGSQRVFKKSTPDNNLTIYVEKRDFVDQNDRPEDIEGMVVVNRAAIGLKKVFGAVVATFRFGREEDEILGMTFCRELYLVHEQIFPPLKTVSQETVTTPSSSTSTSSTTEDLTAAVASSSGSNTKQEAQELKDVEEEEERDQATLLDLPPTIARKRNSLSERITRKLGEDSIPFKFKLPSNAPYSVAMQQSEKDSGDSCSVRYFIRCYVGTDENDKPTTSSTVNLAIRKLQYAPSRPPLQLPTATATKDFPLSPGKLFLEATLSKSLYHHGEDVLVTVLVQNYSNKTVKHMKVSVVQVADICMFSSGRWKVNVACTDTNDRCPITPGKTLQKRFTMVPTVLENKSKYGIFTQGRLTAEEEVLCSTTIIAEKDRADYFGIIISYHVKVKLFLSSIGPLPQSELSCILPFLLMNPDPNQIRETVPRFPRTSREEGDITKDEAKDDTMFESFARGRMRSMSLIG